LPVLLICGNGPLRKSRLAGPGGEHVFVAIGRARTHPEVLALDALARFARRVPKPVGARKLRCVGGGASGEVVVPEERRDAHRIARGIMIAQHDITEQPFTARLRPAVPAFAILRGRRRHGNE
jgi:hypothetical protein